ncbi:CrcB family protein [Microbacterium horticulturae]|uniref:Fluoride-specific ion channel FluC n=1 Tax=Microbacterium horticulturae TaxID=3028316 RepID=A0ABY8BWY9_9MICO|nr:CrcB family protein [Microbacterium sp. KACC 23027]WEG08709.1 CrcB family protein [Microbacterium sp. KACC 23027]
MTSPANTRPLHLRWSSVGLVVAGGFIGTLARYLLSIALPEWGGMPWPILLINVVGAFLLGWLLAALARRGPDVGRRRAVRLFAGTGVLGGFTTYSTFAVGTDGLFVTGDVWPGVLYAVATVLVGAAASLAGILLGARDTRARGVEDPDS